MRVVFFGSPDFAVPSLRALREAGHDVTLVVSQPAKPVGRRALLTDPPVAAEAGRLGLPRFQPPTLKDDGAVARLAAERADVFVVVAYGKILAPRVLDLPRAGCVNVHGSVLPRWRGASPVQASLLAGDAETGITIMRMDPGMDTGPVFAVERTAIGPEEDAGSLSLRLAEMGARLLVRTLPGIAGGTAVPEPQDGTLATTCPKIHREDGRVDWSRPAVELVNRSRAFTPWPGVFCFRARPGGVEERVKLAGLSRVAGSAPHGTVLEAGARVVVACGRDAVAVATLQAEGRRALAAADFARGERLAPGDVLS